MGKYYNIAVNPELLRARNLLLPAIGVLLLTVPPCRAEPRSVLVEKEDFNSSNLLAPEYRPTSGGISFLQPNRFSMRQSYSMSFSSSSAGSLSSGLYLNTLSYRLSNPLTLSADLGFYTPISSTLPGMKQNTLMSQGTGSSVILPRLGLEYQPSENFSVNLEFYNGQDAWKAYGSPFPQFFQNRFP